MGRHELVESLVEQEADGLITLPEMVAEMNVVMLTVPCDCLGCLRFDDSTRNGL